MTGTADPRVALIQMRCRLGERNENLDHIDRLLQQAAGDADLACLPEACDLGYDLKTLDDDLFRLAEPIPGPTTDRLAESAKRCNLAVVAGVTERDPHVHDLLYDTAILIDRKGHLVGRYRKSHLYPDEHRFFRPGEALPLFDVDALRVGIATCFELAFPPIFSTLARKGAQLVLNPSAVPVGYGHLQEVRTPARAQDNQIFVAAVNHVGREGEATYCGTSLLADPRGEVLARASEEDEEVLIASLPLGRIPEQRRQEPVFRGFRPELYEF